MRHPCGNTPVHTVSAVLWFCEYHQAWFGSVQRLRQDSDDVVQLSYHDCELGPFDTAEDALSWATSSLRDTMASPGVPWASPAASAP